jgi:hypothetical protein
MQGGGNRRLLHRLASIPPAGGRRLRGRENAFLDQHFAEFDAVLVVDVEQGDGDAANGGAADQVSPFSAEMLRPFMAAGIEQRRDLTCLLVEAGQIGTLK